MRHYAEYIIDVNEHDFSQRVLDASHERPVLVDFWAQWCPPCRALTPVLEKVVQEYGGAVVLAKVEVDENMRLAGHYRLRGFPTCLLFRDGQSVAHFSGAKAAHFVRDFIAHHAADSFPEERPTGKR